MTPRHITVLVILACGSLQVACAGDSNAPPTLNTSENRPMNAPSASRPPAPIVPPVVQGGIRYEQDRHDERQGDQAGGYLVAIDAKTGARLWRLKVYDVAGSGEPGAPSFAIYFRSMQMRPGGQQLEIENEVGARFSVDLVKHSSTQVSGPAPSAPAQPEPPLPTPE
jgi:hypothetical protein